MLSWYRSVKIACLENCIYSGGFWVFLKTPFKNLPIFLRTLWFPKLYHFPLQVLIHVPYLIFVLSWEILKNYDKKVFDDHDYFTEAAFLRLLSLVTSLSVLAFLVKGNSCLLRVKLGGKLKWIVILYIISWIINFYLMKILYCFDENVFAYHFQLHQYSCIIFYFLPPYFEHRKFVSWLYFHVLCKWEGFIFFWKTQGLSTSLQNQQECISPFTYSHWNFNTLLKSGLSLGIYVEVRAWNVFLSLLKCIGCIISEIQ